MPPLPLYPNVIRLKTAFTIGDDSDVSATLHFAYTGGAPSDSDCTAIATAFKAASTTHVVPVVNGSNYVGPIECTDLSSYSGGSGSDGGPVVGTRSGASLPAGACALANYEISRRYRGGKPRTYWPWGSDGDLNDPQHWSSGALTAFNTAIDNYVTAEYGSTFGSTVISNQVSISYYSGFTPVLNPITGRTRDVPKVRTVAIAPDVIGTVTMNPIVAYQRRRAVR